MTLDELGDVCEERGLCVAISHMSDRQFAVTVSHAGSKKAATARADKLGDAVDLALRRYDARW